MTEDLTLTDVDPDAVSRVATRVELTGIRVAWVNAATNVKAEILPEDWSSGARIGFDSRVKTAVDESGEFAVAASFVAGYSVGWAETGPPEFDPASDTPTDVEIACSFELNYRMKPGEAAGSLDLDHFATLNGTFNAWPYWRELAHSISMRMGIPPLVVRVFVFPGFAASGVFEESSEPARVGD